MAGADVVDRDLDAEPLQRGNDPPRLGEILDRLALGHLEPLSHRPARPPWPGDPWLRATEGMWPPAARWGEHITLCRADPALAQMGYLVEDLDALGDDLQAHVLGEVDQLFDDRAGVTFRTAGSTKILSILMMLTPSLRM